MKRLTLIAIATVLCLGACSRPHSEAMSAALEMYKRYADRSEQLTVAYIGNFEAEGNKYNAVMFQAQDINEWDWLQREFGLKSDIMTMPCTGQNMIVTSVKIDSNMQFASQEELMEYIDSVTKEIMKNTLGTENVDEDMMMSGMPLMSMEEVQKLGYLAEGALDSGTMVMGTPLGEVDTAMLNQHESLINMTDNHKNSGYVIGTDAKEMTLWLFFYDTPEEQQNLMKKFYKDNAEKLTNR